MIQVESPLLGVEVEYLRVDDHRVTEISCSRELLFEEFYALLTSLAERLDAGAPLDVALDEAASRWRDLLQPVDVLSAEKEVGLWGEMWLLNRLISGRGSAMADAWTGPFREPHDFRLGLVEVEVKTTTSVRRTHMIDGLAQLVASPDHSLFVLSLQLEPAGAESGATLPEMIERVKAGLAGDTHRLSLFDAGLKSLGYDATRAGRYVRSWQLRTAPAIVPVDMDLPTITPAVLEATSPAHLARITEVHYRLNVEGLTLLEGSPKFVEIVDGRTTSA
jgi:hypothetical protein